MLTLAEPVPQNKLAEAAKRINELCIDFDARQVKLKSINLPMLEREVAELVAELMEHGYYVRNTNPRKRLHEITARYDLADKVEPFKFCLRCNGTLHQVDKADIADQLEHNTASYYEEFHQCDSCQQIFWKGSHYERMQTLLDEVLGDE